MTDLVGLVASILQLVDTVKNARDYVHAFRDAQSQRKLLLAEIGSLQPLLKQLDNRIQRSQTGGANSVIQNFEEPLIRFRGMMERLAEKLQHDGSFELVGRLTWSLWKKEDVEEELNIVERFKSSLTVGLGLDIWDFANDTTQQYHNHTLATIKDATEEQRIDHHYIFRSVRDIAQRQQQYFGTAARDTIIEWYSPLNFFLRQADIFGIHQPGTGRWFLEANSSKEWKSGVRKVLWCRGMPGAGKTVLMSIAVDHLRAEQKYCDNIGVAAIYLNHKETDAHTPSNLLASLWRQLVVGQPIASVESLYQKHREPGTKPSLNEVHAILSATISEYLKVFILVDALTNIRSVSVAFFLSHLSQLGTNVNLLFTSRPHIILNNSIHVAPIAILEIRATAEDIRCHIDAQILKSSRLSDNIQDCPDLLEEIEKRIVRRSDGIVDLICGGLSQSCSKHSGKSPNNLEGTYDGVMERINSQTEDDRNLALRTLSWISHAKRILRPSELRAALAVEPGTKELDPNNLVQLSIILSVCAGLLVVDARDNRLRLVHFTAQDYLERIQATAFPYASTQITMTCIQYLTTYSDTDYAVEYCLLHAQGEPEHNIMPWIISFLGHTKMKVGWWALWNWKNGCSRGWSPLLIAAVFGLEKVCQHMLKTDAPRDALQLAAASGHLAAEGEFDSALHAAAACGSAKIISLLLANGIDIEYRGPSGTALQVAALFGHKEAVEVLIAGGANVNAPGGSYGSALYAAQGRRAEDVVIALIGAGAVEFHDSTPVLMEGLGDPGSEPFAQRREFVSPPVMIPHWPANTLPSRLDKHVKMNPDTPPPRNIQIGVPAAWLSTAEPNHRRHEGEASQSKSSASDEWVTEDDTTEVVAVPKRAKGKKRQMPKKSVIIRNDVDKNDFCDDTHNIEEDISGGIHDLSQGRH
ncbi:Ankyrin repeat-containing protein [Mycena sanguinolenta]|uniref:Ankyrin repeat-containing protein n=1 Tax=Mycena sanguinolenta TaxID=230812 RepID=A0A8H6WRT6_9AGAR|nr:Ankyrin repeat-containing protein [Mycena sanguinolenta]